MSDPLTQSPVPALYIVATPIGHLGDMTQRALSVLGSVSRILAEDTRHTQKLLRHYAIECPLVSLHEHNETGRISQIERWLSDGEALALVSDAGTPLISDPGYPLVRALTDAGHQVIPIPGASALTTALCVSGLPTDRFQFCGFLPAKSGARVSALQSALTYTGTTVFYESPRRIATTLSELVGLAPDRATVVARELTKQFETLLRGTATEVAAQVQADTDQQRGEIVLLVGGAERQSAASGIDTDALLQLLDQHLPPKKAAGEAAALTGGSKNELYRRLLALRSGDEKA